MTRDRLPAGTAQVSQQINTRKSAWFQHITVFRVIVAAGFLIAAVLTLAVPARMSDPDDWAYYYAVQNFSQGHFTVDTQTHTQQVSQAQQQGGQLIQYWNIGNNRWAFEKGPGYVLYLVPFKWLGLPRGGNLLLALGMVIVTFWLLKRLRDEKTAMIGSWLMLFNPVSLVMLNRAYMDSFAALAFLVMGGGLYIYYHLERKNLRPLTGGIILFLAFFLTGWSVVTRYTNLPVAVILGLHFVITRWIYWRKGATTGIRQELIPLLTGILIPVAAILFYNYSVFGSPWKYGYQYTRFPIKFAFQYLGQVSQGGQSMPLQIILNNLRNAPRALLLGFPLLIIGIPALVTVLYFKIGAFIRKGRVSGTWSSLHTELPWDIVLVLVGWFVAVFGLYLTYEWTADFQGAGAFITFDRFYLPGLFPIVVICALIMARFPFKLYIPALLIVAGFGALLYGQYALNWQVLPAWLSGGGGMPGGGRGGGPGGGGPGGMSPGGGSGNRANPWGNGGLPQGNGAGGGFQPPAGN